MPENEAAASAADTRQPGNLRLQPFFESKPKIWFELIEEQFLIYKISADALRYAHLVSAQTDEPYSIVSAALYGSTQDKYETAKRALIKQYTKSQYARYQAIFHTPPLGDQKPSTLLRYMVDHLDDEEAQKPGAWLKWLWFSLLPEHVREHLLSDAVKAGDDELPLRQLAELADMRISNDIRRIDAVSRPAKIKPAKKDDDKPDWCFYHNRFGNKAKKCKDGCLYTEN